MFHGRNVCNFTRYQALLSSSIILMLYSKCSGLCRVSALSHWLFTSAGIWRQACRLALRRLGAAGVIEYESIIKSKLRAIW